MRKYFYTDRNEKFGPFELEELKKKALSIDTKVWFYGLEKWTPISEIESLQAILDEIPPAIPIIEVNTKLKVDIDQQVNPTVISDSKRKQSLDYSSEYLNFKSTLNQGKQSEKDNSADPIPYKVNLFLDLKSKKGMIVFSIGLIIILTVIAKFKSNETIIDSPPADFYEPIDYAEIAASSYDADEDFNFYVDKFYRDLTVYGLNPRKPAITIIKFAKLDQMKNTTHIHGVSFGINDDSRIEIYINPTAWQNFKKPMRYFLMYHELSHDVLNVDDLEDISSNDGKLMYPALSSFENKNMDDFIEASHALFEKEALKIEMSH